MLHPPADSRPHRLVYTVFERVAESLHASLREDTAMRTPSLICVAFGALGLWACATAPTEKSAKGFSLPDGDPAAGKAAFVRLQCSSCHTVEDERDLPRPVVDPPVPVTLGGERLVPSTDGSLVTSIIHPSHEITKKQLSSLVTTGEKSRMGSFTESMTVQELIDLVAYLHSKERVGAHPPPVAKAPHSSP